MNKIKFKDLLIKEAEDTEEKSEKVIQDLINTDWSKDNEAQMKASQLMIGLSTSNTKAANDFMKKMSDFTTAMGKK